MLLLHTLTTVGTVLTVLILQGYSKPVYDDTENYDYLQMLAAKNNAKQQRYLEQLYDEMYGSYDYPDYAFQDYINKLLREKEWPDNMNRQYGEEYGAEEEEEPRLDMEVSSSWPAKKLAIGQVVGVAVDSDSNPHIFHRGERVWGEGKRLFDENHQYLAKSEGPIKAATVLQLSQEDGSVLKEWGENRFYLPHGLTIDMEGNFWLTDVALHQVFKFEPGKKEPTLVLGEAFQPAEDEEDSQRFCQPTDVAVSSEGDIYVSDGYCNRRIVKFDEAGNMVGQIPLRRDSTSVPHSITLAEELDLVCVADREERSILCFNAGIDQPDTFGKFEREYTEPSIGRIFAIEYNPETGLLHAVTDASSTEDATGFTVDLHQETSTADIIDQWSPYNRGFSSPHDIAVSPEGNTLYVGEIAPNHIWKFTNTAGQNDMENIAPEYDTKDVEDEAGKEVETGEEVEAEKQAETEKQAEAEEGEKEVEEEEEEGGKENMGEELEEELEKEEEQLMGQEHE